MKPLATVTRWQQAASHLSAIASCHRIPTSARQHHPPARPSRPQTPLDLPSLAPRQSLCRGRFMPRAEPNGSEAGICGVQMDDFGCRIPAVSRVRVLTFLSVRTNFHSHSSYLINYLIDFSNIPDNMGCVRFDAFLLPRGEQPSSCVFTQFP